MFVRASSILLLSLATSALAHRVVTLDDSNFTSVTSGGQWIVKFYAPWCGHCKRLAPVFEEAAAAAGADAARFATVDCTVATSVASSQGIRGYPTLKIISDGKVMDLEAPRTKSALAAVARRLTAPPLTAVRSESELNALLRSTPGPVLAVGPDTDEVLAGSFENVAGYWRHEQVFADLRFGSTRGVVRLEAGGVQPVSYEGDEDAISLERWMRAPHQRYASLVKLDHTNYMSATHSGLPVSVAVVDPAEPSSSRFLASYKRLALPGQSPLGESVRSAFLFASLDGKRYADALPQFNVSPDDLPRVIVIDGSAGTFYEDPLVREVSDVESFLAEVAAGQFPAQRSGMWAVPTKVWNLVVLGEMGWGVAAAIVAGAVVLLAGLLAGAWVCCCGGEGEEEQQGGGEDGDGHAADGEEKEALQAALRKCADAESLTAEDLEGMSDDELLALMERNGLLASMRDAAEDEEEQEEEEEEEEEEEQEEKEGEKREEDGHGDKDDHGSAAHGEEEEELPAQGGDEQAAEQSSLPDASQDASIRQRAAQASKSGEEEEEEHVGAVHAID